MTVVFDTNVFISAVVAPGGSSRRCFTLLARRRFRAAVTSEILIEYETVAERLAQRPGEFRGMNWRPLFNWLRDTTIYVEPMPLGKARSRDMSDDIFLGCALAAGAATIVTHDADLLTLGKPFGVEMVKPTAFVARIQAL